MLEAIASGLGSLVGAGVGLWEGSKNREMQKEFAQNGIRWKVADANAAGVHPLYALGAQTHSFSPVTTGAGSHLAQMGQDIASSINRTRTKGEQVSAYAKSLESLTLEKFGLENMLLRSQIAKINAAPSPGLPGSAYLIDGQPSSGLVVNKAMERTAPGSKPFQEPGAITDTGWARTPTGLAPVPSYDVKQRIEDQIIPEMQWSIRNNLIPSISREGAKLRQPPASALPGWADRWEWNTWAQEYQPKRSTRDAKPVYLNLKRR